MLSETPVRPNLCIFSWLFSQPLSGTAWLGASVVEQAAAAAEAVKKEAKKLNKSSIEEVKTWGVGGEMVLPLSDR